jgi:hypothetical protein
MSIASIAPANIQTLGQPFFRLYLSKYPEVFQQWILDHLAYEFALSYPDRLFPHISEIPKGYDIFYNEPDATTTANTVIAEEDEDEEEYDPYSKQLPPIKLSDVSEFTYYARLRSKGKTQFCGVYLQFKFLEANDYDLIHNLMDDYLTCYSYTKVSRILPIPIYIGDYPFYSPTREVCLFHRFSSTILDLTQFPLDKITTQADFHIHVLAMFNHQMPEAEKVDFIVDGMKRTHQEKGMEEAEYYFRLLELSETPKNLPALLQIFERLAHLPEYQHLQRKTLSENSQTWTADKLNILQVMIDKAITVMYKTDKNALEAARFMDFEPVEFQTLLNHVDALGGVVKYQKPTWM